MNDIGFKIIQEFPNGLIYEFITDSNQKFEVFIPNNYSSDVSIVLYEHSDGGYFDDWESYLNKFSSRFHLLVHKRKNLRKQILNFGLYNTNKKHLLLLRKEQLILAKSYLSK